MKKSTIIPPLYNMKEALSQNIETINSLLGASESMKKSIASLPQQPDSREVAELMAAQETVSESVNSLLEHTATLLAAYKEVAEHV